MEFEERDNILAPFTSQDYICDSGEPPRRAAWSVRTRLNHTIDAWISGTGGLYVSVTPLATLSAGNLDTHEGAGTSIG